MRDSRTPASFEGFTVDTPTRDELAELAARARGGDRAAEDALARAVWPWVKRKAGEYGRSHRVDSDELESVGLSRFPHALKSYRPEFGGFLNYFASCAAREMLEVARKLSRRPEVQSEEALVMEPGHADEPDDVAALRAALAGLDPLSRRVLEMALGYDGKAVRIDAAAALLGLSPRRAELIYRLAFNRLSDELHET